MDGNVDHRRKKTEFNHSLFIKEINLLGQCFALHGLYSTATPRWLQFLPPYFGMGLLQYRVHVSKP